MASPVHTDMHELIHKGIHDKLLMVQSHFRQGC